MFPKTLTLIDDDQVYVDGLAGYLRGEGIVVSTFADGRDFLAHPDPYGFNFYIADLMLPGIDGTELIKVLRMRTNAGVLVVSGRASADTFKEVIRAGADMYLTKPVVFEQVALAIEAVHGEELDRAIQDLTLAFRCTQAPACRGFRYRRAG